MLASRIVEPSLQQDTENLSVVAELVNLDIALRKTKKDLKKDFFCMLSVRENINLNFLTHFHPSSLYFSVHVLHCCGF